LHAKLLDTLIARGARAVVFDVVFADESPDPQVDVRFAEALQRAAGKVVLAGSVRPFQERSEARGSQMLQPTERLASAAPWGVVEMPQDPDGALRRHPTFAEPIHLAWKAVELVGVALPDP